MVSDIENVDIAAEIMGLLLLRLRSEIEQGVVGGAGIKELLGRDGLADAAVRLVQTALKLEEVRSSKRQASDLSMANIDNSSERLTDEDIAVLQALLPLAQSE